MSQGILLLDKPRGKSSFFLVTLLRKVLKERKIGHAGTLDPFATGVMVMLIGRQFTKKSAHFVAHDKEYSADLLLGASSTTYDCEGSLSFTEKVSPPTLSQIETALTHFQGEIEQLPPMFCAKKIAGRKLYQLARKGVTIDRPLQKVEVTTTLLSYTYPHLKLHITCSKGTYIRSLAHDLGQRLGCGAYLQELRRLRSGPFLVGMCHDPFLLREGCVGDLIVEEI